MGAPDQAGEAALTEGEAVQSSCLSVSSVCHLPRCVLTPMTRTLAGPITSLQKESSSPIMIEQGNNNASGDDPWMLLRAAVGVYNMS